MIGFDELEIKDTFKKDLIEEFSKDDVYECLGSEVYIYSTQRKEYTSFPCISIRLLDNNTNTRYSTTENVENFTNFTFEADIYSQDLDKYDRDDAVVKIASLLISSLQAKYKMSVTMNQNQPNLNKDTYRRIVRMTGIYDNKHNMIYQNY